METKKSQDPFTSWRPKSWQGRCKARERGAPRAGEDECPSSGYQAGQKSACLCLSGLLRPSKDCMRPTLGRDAICFTQSTSSNANLFWNTAPWAHPEIMFIQIDVYLGVWSSGHIKLTFAIPQHTKRERGNWLAKKLEVIANMYLDVDYILLSVDYLILTMTL